MRRLFPIILLLGFLISTALGAVEYGIAKNYPFDQNIQTDPSVVLYEPFEYGQLIQMQPGWKNFKNPWNMYFVPDKPTGGGIQSLLMKGNGHMFRTYPGQDTLYMRFYTKFADNCQGYHHFVWLGGQNPPTSQPMPMAGSKPTSYKYFNTSIEPYYHGSWQWDFYTYWWEMHADGAGSYWGNKFVHDPTITVPHEQWICVELMVKMNSPVTSKNGEQAFWVNGEKRAHIGQGFPTGKWGTNSNYWYPGTGAGTLPFEGFQWRTVPELNLNNIWLENEVTGVDPGEDCWCYYDNLVLSTKYIGPTTGTGTAPNDIAAPGIYNMTPKDGDIGKAPGTNISLTLRDHQSGVDRNSIKMWVNNIAVTPAVTGADSVANVVYDPPVDFAPGSTVQVRFDAQDKNAVPNKIKTLNYSFVITGTPGITDSRKSINRSTQTQVRPMGRGEYGFDLRLFNEGGFALDLYDLSGKHVWKYSGESRDLSAHVVLPKAAMLKNGVYLLRVSQQGRSATDRVILAQ